VRIDARRRWVCGLHAYFILGSGHRIRHGLCALHQGCTLWRWGNDGLQVDGDYDDLIVGLRVVAVPDPETHTLLLAGLGAVGFIAPAGSAERKPSISERAGSCRPFSFVRRFSPSGERLH
jgi:hypothetical protein